MFAFFVNQISFSQTYNFEYYNIEEGLPQSQVNAITQDTRGYLWVGTSGGGICKFDGLSFTKYNEKDGIAGDIITDITTDKDGNLWFTSSWGGVTKYNGRKFNVFSTKDGLLNSDGNNVVYTDQSNKIWIGSEYGLVTYKNGTFKKYTKENSKLISNNVNCIKEDNKGNIWVGSNGGITLLGKNNTIFISTIDGLPSNKVSAIEEDVYGNIYIGTNKGLVKILEGSIDANKDFAFEYPLKSTYEVTDILIDKSKNVWITTKKNGAFIIDKDKKITPLNKKNGLITNSLLTIFQDKSGNIWIGTNGAGLIKYGNKAFTYFNNIQGLNNPGIFSITSDNEDNIWVSTNDEGVFKYNGFNSTQYTTANGLGSNTVRSSLIDNRGNLWFATSKGLTKYKNGVFRNFTIKDGLPSNNIRTLLLDSSNNLWIGTFGFGLSKYDYSTFKNFSKKDGLPNDYIHSLFQDSKGNIWIGTGNGVAKYNNNSFTSYTDSKRFCNLYIGSIAEDKYGQIWFGTDRCVVRYDGLDFKAITVEDGLSSGVIYLLKGDANGNMWIGTNNGIDKISFDSYGQIDRIKNYKSKQGFKGVECNSRAIFEDKKHNLWIGTVKGLVKYSPTEDRTNVFEPTIHINNIKLFFKNVNWLNRSKDLIKWSNLPKKLTLENDENHLTFEFSAINLTFPEDVSYRIQLTPFDKQWYDATNKNSATYSNLPPGEYTFSVKAGNEDGVWNQKPAEYSFKILSPWWKKWWVILLLSIAIFYLIFKISTVKEKQQRIINNDLEKKVRERTLLIESQRDEKEILLKEIHHRVKNNMQVIISLLSIQSNYTTDKSAIALFDEAKNRIRSMALIHEKMYQTGDLALIDFQDYIMALTNDLIATYSINCNIFLDIKIDNVKFGVDALIPLGLLINEVISNTLKYAFINKDKGKIKIHLAVDEKENGYTLLIGDNGSGMPKGIFEKEDGSLGMELIKIFVNQLEGTIKLLNGTGTVYKINFQLRE